MAYPSLQSCLADLEKHGHLIRIKEEVDPYLDMAAIHLKVHQAQGPAILFCDLLCDQTEGMTPFRAGNHSPR